LLVTKESFFFFPHCKPSLTPSRNFPWDCSGSYCHSCSYS